MAFKGSTLVHIAASQGLHSTLTELVNRGVKLNKLDETGQTALHYVVRGNDLTMVSRLLNLSSRSRPAINAISHVSGEYPLNNATALMIAVWNSHLPIIWLLLE